MNRRVKLGKNVGPIFLLTAAVALGVTGCATNGATPAADAAPAATVEITDNHRTIEVPVDPQRVVVLDNTLMETVSDWGIPLVAAPKGVMGNAWPEYIDDEAVADVGSHREPNLEVIVAADPDVILTGYRFANYYDELVAQNPDAVVLEITPRDGEDVFAELARETEIMGQIFDREAEATELNEKLDGALAAAKKAYNGTDTVMAVNTSAGSIGYLAPVVGRSLGPVFPALGLVPALEAEGTDDHRGNDIGVEAIAQSNPDWIVALDRDAAFVPEERDPGSAPAQELIVDSEALQNVTAVTKDQIVILDPNFYLTEGIQAYTELFEQLRAAFAAA